MHNKNKLLFFATSWTVIIAFLSLATLGNLGGSISIPNKDKIVHFIMYFIFVILWALYRNTKEYKSKTGLIIALIAISYGGLIEIFQELFTSTRCADFFDFLANSTGALLGMFFINKHLINKRKI